MKSQVSLAAWSLFLLVGCSSMHSPNHAPRKPSSDELAPAYPLNARFEATLQDEEQYVGQIRAGILALQEKEHSEHGKYLRGTHSKGTCVGGTMEIFDVATSAPAVAARIKKGLFSVPGNYPADVRFANADGKINPDDQKDVRAVSFSLQVPEEISNPSRRLDFAMNNATTFPINDAQVFADVLRVALDGPVKSTEEIGFWREKRALGAIANGKLVQEQPGRTPYQKIRYWSTVPFSLGDDEAVKYSLVPCPANHAASLAAEDPDTLRNELIRNVNEDPTMSCFEFRVQLLNADKMTHGFGSHESESWWVENAATEWPESEAPFYPVGRLTLVPHSVVDAPVCERRSIDVIAHSSPAQHGLGSINRARALAERASAAKRLQ